MANFCATEGLDAVLVGSAFRSGFGTDYGITMADGNWRGLLARAIVVLDEEGTVLHTQITSAISVEPDYDAAIAALGLTRQRHTQSWPRQAPRFVLTCRGVSSCGRNNARLMSTLPEARSGVPSST